MAADRVVTGYFRWEGHATGAGALPAPYIYVYLGDTGLRNRAPFLVDTGCDYTTLSPQDAHRLFGDNYLTMDFSRRPESIEMHGIGDTPAFGLRTRAELTFLADNGDEITLDTPIVIAQPMPPDARTSWQLAHPLTPRPRHPPALRPRPLLQPTHGVADGGRAHLIAVTEDCRRNERTYRVISRVGSKSTRDLG